jgi:hypothetical protein
VRRRDARRGRALRASQFSQGTRLTTAPSDDQHKRQARK